MSSACANPVIYGFLNENFSKEFRLIWLWWKDWIKQVIRIIFPGLLRPDDPSTMVVQPVVIVVDHDGADHDTISNAMEMKQIKKWILISIRTWMRSLIQIIFFNPAGLWWAEWSDRLDNNHWDSSELYQSGIFPGLFQADRSISYGTAANHELFISWVLLLF